MHSHNLGRYGSSAAFPELFADLAPDFREFCGRDII